MFYKFLIALATVGVALATVGVDLSQLTSQSSFDCVKNLGYDFAIVRVYCSPGYVDSNGPTNIARAWASGMAHVDGYIFPCYSCGNPSGQMDTTIEYLSSHVNIEGLDGFKRTNETVGATVGMLWLDIEGTQYWGSSTSANTQFIVDMAARGKARGVSIGIYSSKSQWNPITGGTTALSSYPLWYASWDYNYNFNDWSPFGGWSSPAIKQYAGDQSYCSAGWDKNYY